MRILFYCRGDEALGVESLVAVLKQAGHRVDLLFDSGINDLFYYHLQLLDIFRNERGLIEKAKRFSPDLLAFSSTTNDYPYVSEMIAKLKKVLKVPVIVGGVHATAVPEFVIKHPGVDMVCRGEGEGAFLELVNRMSSGKDYYDTKNIWFKKRKRIIKKNAVRPLIKDLDSLPFPDKDLFYNYGCFNDMLMVSSSRGCIFNCSYCHNCLARKLYKGDSPYLRRMSVKYFISLLSYYKKRYKIKKVAFVDDIFAINKDWLREFSYYYSREISLPFYCHAFFSLLDQEIVTILEQSGCYELLMGFESGNSCLRRNLMKRSVGNEKIKETVNMVKNSRIMVEVSVIFGWPGETPEYMWDSVKLLNELSPSYVDGHVLYPYPGTDILQHCRKEGLVNKEHLLRIYKGVSSDVGEMVFNHPYKDLAYVMSKLTPIYVKAPFFLKPILKIFMRPHMKRFVNWLYLLLIPFLLPWRGLERMKELIAMVIQGNKKRKI